MSIRRVALAVALVFAGLFTVVPAQETAPISPSLFDGMKWRAIGPHRGSRTVAAAGHRAQPHTFYMAAVNGGVWKTTDAGRTWNEAPFKEPLSPLTWVIWQVEWTPGSEGAYELRVRATDKNGALQSSSTAASYPSGASGYHTVSIAVAKA